MLRSQMLGSSRRLNCCEADGGRLSGAPPPRKGPRGKALSSSPGSPIGGQSRSSFMNGGRSIGGTAFIRGWRRRRSSSRLTSAANRESRFCRKSESIDFALHATAKSRPIRDVCNVSFWHFSDIEGVEMQCPVPKDLRKSAHFGQVNGFLQPYCFGTLTVKPRRARGLPRHL